MTAVEPGVVLTTAAAKPKSEESPARRAFRRLLRRKGAVVGLAVVLTFVSFALLADFVAPYSPIEADWSAIEAAPLAGLVTSLCMICPFEPEEKQALLEAGDGGCQARLLIALMEMEALAEPGGSSARH